MFKHLIAELQHETKTDRISGRNIFVIREISIHIFQYLIKTSRQNKFDLIDVYKALHRTTSVYKFSLSA